ncbi:hypothetical protein WJX75_007712 [Coccomyxa subellipsoidea]|uniref:Peptidase A1 domain-containing protein n=1 Tax=Coccomyxa subellipsoidea TaxID=248742 RepID=A0ABR2YDH1_9CHLO
MGTIRPTILGLGFTELAVNSEQPVFQNLANQNLIPPTDLTKAPSGLKNSNTAAYIFSFSLTPTPDALPDPVPGGTTTLGGFDARVFNGQISCSNVQVSSNRWQIALDSITCTSATFPTVGGPTSALAVVIDSGSSGIVLPSKEFGLALAAIGASTVPSPVTVMGTTVCPNPIPCSTFRNAASPLPVFKFQFGGREYSITEEEYIVRAGFPDTFYILGEAFIAKYPAIFDTTSSANGLGPRICFEGTIPAVMSLSDVVFKTDPAGSPGQVTFDVINRGDSTPATVAVTVTYQNPDGSVISVDTSPTSVSSSTSATTNYISSVPVFGSITAVVRVTAGAGFVLDNFSVPAKISFTNQASTLITSASIEKGPVLLKPTTKRVVASLLYMSPLWPPPAADLTITIPATSTQALPTVNTAIPSFPVTGTV